MACLILWADSMYVQKGYNSNHILSHQNPLSPNHTYKHYRRQLLRTHNELKNNNTNTKQPVTAFWGVTQLCYETQDESQITIHIVHYIWPRVQLYMGYNRVSFERVPYSFAVNVGVEDQNLKNKQ